MPKIKTIIDRQHNYCDKKYVIMDDDEERIFAYQFVKPVWETGKNGQPRKIFVKKFYCPKCKAFSDHKMHENIVRKERFIGEDQYEHYETKVVASIECLTCGTNVKSENILPLEYSKKGVQTAYPLWAGHSIENHFVKFKWIEARITAFNDKLQIEHVRYYLNFNTLTGQTYYFEPYVLSATEKKGKRAPWYTKAKMINVSYMRDTGSFHPIPDSILWDLYEVIYEKISSNLGYKPVHLKSYYEKKELEQMAQPKEKKRPRIEAGIFSRISIYDIIAFNRMPNIGPREYRSLINVARNTIRHRDDTIEKISHETTIMAALNKMKAESKSRKEKKKISELLKAAKVIVSKRPNSIIHKKVSSIKSNNPDPIGTLMKNYNLPNVKSIRKILLEDPHEILVMARICEYFSDINNVRRIYESQIFNGIYSRSTNHSIAKFMSLMIDKFGETVWTTKLISGKTQQTRNDWTMVVDTANMYFKIQKNMKAILKKLPNIKIELTGNIREMHDNFSYVLDVLDKENVLLRPAYTENDLKYECEIDGYTIKLADDTHELRRVGKFMHICVGTLYSSRAVERDCNIALMLKDNRYIMCVELSGDMKTVKQAKMDCNSRPKDEPEEIITKWINKLKLTVDTYDLPDLRTKPENNIEDDWGEENPRQRMLRRMNIRLEQEEVRAVNF